jgi:hypothetical protein
VASCQGTETAALPALQEVAALLLLLLLAQVLLLLHHQGARLGPRHSKALEAAEKAEPNQLYLLLLLLH